MGKQSIILERSQVAASPQPDSQRSPASAIASKIPRAPSLSTDLAEIDDPEAIMAALNSGLQLYSLSPPSIRKLKLAI
jgi:hypothetical protein